jgi:N-acetyl-gamma-glutamyl-phosphate reductase
MKKIAIIGATGYTGSELIRLLNKHKQVKVVCITSTSQAGIAIKSLYPTLDSDLVLEEYSIEKIKSLKIDLVFLATPHGTSMKFASELLENNIRVVDLSADFRFNDTLVYEKKYPKHTHPELCKEAVYGLTEVCREKVKKAMLVGNPGCYVTSVLLPMIPIKDYATDIIVDSKSGVSGAGVKVAEQMQQFINANDFKAYGVSNHRHQVEIEYYLDSKIEFTPHLLPIDRGILSTIYFKSDKSLEELQTILAAFYADSLFVKCIQEGDPKISDVVFTNKCLFKVYKGSKDNSFIVVSVIDNLIKGASGQAIQNMNLMFGFDEAEGLM